MQVGRRRRRQGTGTQGDCLGLSYLMRFDVTIDYPKATVYLAKGKRFSEPDVSPDRSGLHLLRKGGMIVVDLVDKESPAREAGIRPGDKIMQLQGKNVKEYPLVVIRRLLRSPDARTIRVTLQRGKTSVDAQFGLRETPLRSGDSGDSGLQNPVPGQ